MKKWFPTVLTLALSSGCGAAGVEEMSGASSDLEPGAEAPGAGVDEGAVAEGERTGTTSEALGGPVCTNVAWTPAANSVGYCECALTSGSDGWGVAQANTNKLKACVNALVSNGTLALPAWTAAYAMPLDIAKRVNMQTTGRGANCSATAAYASCATLIASSTASHVLHLLPGAAYSSIRFMRFNGNKGPRPYRLSGLQFPLVTLEANNVTFSGNAVFNNIAGQALVIGGFYGEVAHYSTITANDVRDNGIRSPWIGGYTVSDGLAVKDGTGHNISGNFLRNNTDVDLIFGGCRSCTVSGNTIHHSSDGSGRANAGIMLQQWMPVPGVSGWWSSGVFDGSSVVQNTVNCNVDGTYSQNCGAAIELGCRRWPGGTPCTDWMTGGYIANNNVANAAMGILVNAGARALVHNNNVWSSGGRTYCGGRLVPACSYTSDSAASGLSLYGGNCGWSVRDDLVHNCLIAGSP